MPQHPCLTVHGDSQPWVTHPCLLPTDCLFYRKWVQLTGCRSMTGRVQTQSGPCASLVHMGLADNQVAPSVAHVDSPPAAFLYQPFCHFLGTSVSAVLPHNMLLLQLLAHNLLHHQSLHYTVKKCSELCDKWSAECRTGESMFSCCMFYLVTVASPCE